jgi:1-phosphofructokinase family hexose kinase
MILTVTPNSALDKVIFIEEWVPGSPMRTDKIVTSVGGKGLDTSVVLSCLGVKTVGLAFVAGSIGRELIKIVEGYGIVSDPIWVEGETRVAHVIVENKHRRHSHIITGRLSINQEKIEEFFERYRIRLKEASWVTCGGSIPPDFSPTLFCRIVKEAHQADVPVLIDGSGDVLEVTISTLPDIIKMNWREFELTFDVEAPSFNELIHHARRIANDLHIKSLVLTCSSEGILAFTINGPYHVSVPKQEPVNAAGAGDAVSAALAWRLSAGDKWSEALKWAGAVSSASVLTEGTADCEISDVHRIYPQVQVRKL